ncbi:MAG: hypothetical protein JW958_06065 [Candidatus Eisenbacteria bacterium]|nr:hypothetical protein [Candidatus Eisenbacteria bacterium]
MEILIGIVLYFGLAVFVGRFLSLSTAGEMIFPVSGSRPTPPLYEPIETANLNLGLRRDRAPTDGEREREEAELILR